MKKILGLTLFVLVFSVRGQTFPDKPVTLVVPFPPGGPSDALARQASQKAQAKLGQTIVIDNTSGAAGGIGTAKVARAKADGYTLSVGTIGTRRQLAKDLETLVPVIKSKQGYLD